MHCRLILETNVVILEEDNDDDCSMNFAAGRQE